MKVAGAGSLAQLALYVDPRVPRSLIRANFTRTHRMQAWWEAYEWWVTVPVDGFPMDLEYEHFVRIIVIPARCWARRALKNKRLRRKRVREVLGRCF